jgi:hypothetical protein
MCGLPALWGSNNTNTLGEKNMAAKKAAKKPAKKAAKKAGKKAAKKKI